MPVLLSRGPSTLFLPSFVLESYLYIGERLAASTAQVSRNGSSFSLRLWASHYYHPLCQPLLSPVVPTEDRYPVSRLPNPFCRPKTFPEYIYPCIFPGFFNCLLKLCQLLIPYFLFTVKNSDCYAAAFIIFGFCMTWDCMPPILFSTENARFTPTRLWNFNT